MLETTGVTSSLTGLWSCHSIKILKLTRSVLIIDGNPLSKASKQIGRIDDIRTVSEGNGWLSSSKRNLALVGSMHIYERLHCTTSSKLFQAPHEVFLQQLRGV
jgi:hypothetical protein